MRRFNKIFGIGIARTGTLSLNAALESLGVPSIHWPRDMAEIAMFRGATDTTVACRYRELDLIFPDSLFIYTERNARNWLPSVTRHYQRRSTAHMLPTGKREFAQEATIRIFGRLRPEAGDFLAAYQRHHAGVLEYFSKRPEHLLRIKIARGKGWTALCRFLEVPEPRMPFPHRNRS